MNITTIKAGLTPKTAALVALAATIVNATIFAAFATLLTRLSA